jgi:putative phosphoesterase
MKILITSDSHDRWEYLELAVQEGIKVGCEVMLFAGDFMSPGGVKILEQFSGDVHFVLGNNDGELVGLTRWLDKSKNVTLHYKFGESTLEEEIDGVSFYMNHFPDAVKNAALSGKYDVCVYGHDHMYHEEILGNGTILLNPGEIQGYKTGNSTCMIFDTSTKKVEKIILN